MKILYITDLDGTLLNDSAEPSDNTINALNSLIEQGVTFSIATARTYATVMKMFDKVKLNCPIVLMNGVTIYSPENREIIQSYSINKASAERILEIYERNNEYPMLYFQTEESTLDIYYKELTNEQQKIYVGNRNNYTDKKFFKLSSPVDLTQNKLVYMTSLDTFEKLKPIYDEIKLLKDVCCVFYRDNYTNLYFLETFSNLASKAIGALKVKELTKADKIVAFGDNLNDIPLFSVADECYAVENACQELKDIATDVIGYNYEDAVVNFIKERMK